MTVRNRLSAVVGVILALWMGVGRWAFGIGGDLTWWYVPLLTVPYIGLHLWLLRRMRIAADRGRRLGRAPWVALALSWVSAVGFGFTVPDTVNGVLISIAGLLGGPLANELAIALCNPFGIVAFATLIIALAYAAAAARDPRPEEDDLLGEEMVPHPLGRSAAD